MNIIGEIQLGNEIKILDAFDFPEQFSLVPLSAVFTGLWVALNETAEDEMMGDIVTQFMIIQKEYYQKNNDIDQYDWQKQDRVISIEKGIVGFYEIGFNGSENYRNELDDTVSNDNQAGVMEGYVVCRTPFGNDGNFSIALVKQDEKIVAIQINFNIDE